MLYISVDGSDFSHVLLAHHMTYFVELNFLLDIIYFLINQLLFTYREPVG